MSRGAYIYYNLWESASYDYEWTWTYTYHFDPLGSLSETYGSSNADYDDFDAFRTTVYDAFGKCDYGQVGTWSGFAAAALDHVGFSGQ